MASTDPVELALAASKEGKRIEFKSEFEPTQSGAWCEILKDIAALANAGGGVILFGVDDSGEPTGWNPRPLLAVDTADIGNQITKYTGENFDDFQISEHSKKRRKIVALSIGPRTGSPLVFLKPGTYPTERDNKQSTAFSRGSIYFRHGSKSEPCTSRDIERFIQAELARTRREFLKNVRKVAAAPTDAEVLVLTPKVGPSERASRFRVVDDPNAPALARTDFDVTHPYRQTELVSTINDRVGSTVAGPYEIQCVRRVHGVDQIPEFFHRPKFGSPQYSDAFVSWLVTEYQRDTEFFVKAKQAAAMQRTGSTKSN
jgi:hypothetical protein